MGRGPRTCRGNEEGSNDATHAHGCTECTPAGCDAAADGPTDHGRDATPAGRVCATLTVGNDPYPAGPGARGAFAGDQLHWQRRPGGDGRYRQLSERGYGVGRPGEPG